MRTTLNIDDDVLLAVRERARRDGRPTGQVLSDLARRALTGAASTDPTTGPGRHGFHPLPRRGPTVSNAMIDRLREDEPE